MQFLDPFLTHRPGPDCDHYVVHQHQPDGSIVWNLTKPGLYRSNGEAVRWLALPLALGCAIWVIAVISVWALLRAFLP